MFIYFKPFFLLNHHRRQNWKIEISSFRRKDFVLYEEYKEALPVYRSFLKLNPDNSNFKYRIGQCLINMPGRKQEAISYLEDAVRISILNTKKANIRKPRLLMMHIIIWRMLTG